MKKHKFVTEIQVNALMKACAKTRYELRNKVIILLMYKHGLRVSELLNLCWNDIDFDSAKIYIHRMKNSKSGYHPLFGEELRLLRRFKREQSDNHYLFVSQKKTILHRNSVRDLVKQLSAFAYLDDDITPHSLRHACGYALVNKGVDTRTIQEYLGHKNIQNTVIYTEISEKRFRNLWDK